MARVWMRWLHKHHAYYARFKASQYEVWYDKLVTDLGADDAMLCDAVDEMINSGFSGYLEAHFTYLMRWVTERKRCPLCNNSGAVRVPNRRQDRAGSSIIVSCRCPLQSKAKTRYGSSMASIDDYERKYGCDWRDPPGKQLVLALEAPRGTG